MIEQIDIESFGSFEAFEWRRSIRDRGNNIANFKRLNILYGRNYSGKTTLSRVFRSMQEGVLPWNHEGARFIARGQSLEITQNNLKTHGQDIRVYNKDFVSENLSFLTDHHDGQIKTFAIVGSDNKRIIDDLDQINGQLGSIESKSGARYENFEAEKLAKNTQLKAVEARASIDDRLRRYANETIKPDRLIGKPNYNIEHIKADITFIRSNSFTQLNDQEKFAKTDLLKQEQLPPILETPSFPTGMEGLRTKISSLLTRAVTPTKALDDLLGNPTLQAWVKEGIRHHKDIRHSCAFCRQDLPANLWGILSDHFNREFEALEADIDASLRDIRSEKEAIARRIVLREDQFYATERPAFLETNAEISEAYAIYSNELEAMEAALKQRHSSLFNPVTPPPPIFDRAAAESTIDKMLAVVAKSNARTETLGRDQDEARTALRRNSVLDFIIGIEYESKVTQADVLNEEAARAMAAAQTAKEAEQTLVRHAAWLEAQLKDERKGAERINELLSHFFGHGGIRLDAVESGTDQPGFKFQITRAGKTAYHLSEGECSLIAFCYFMALLEAPESSGRELILYIDDPISSLDSNHVFFMFSLIETLIARPNKNEDGSNRYRYKQLFLSTHNLEFLKYLKSLSAPNSNHGGTEYFIVEKHADNPSRLSLMPGHLKDFATEFNYLFHQIYRCSRATPAGESNEHYYSFGNNLRKFLEAYLFFRYPTKPGSEDTLTKMTRFFGTDGMAATLSNRLSNELSHLNFDRSMRPIDISEIRTLASYVLGKIKEADGEQYGALLTSIGVAPDAD